VWPEYRSNIIIRIYRNDAGIFTDINANLIAYAMGAPTWVGFDKDGRLDLLLAGR
jgi:hypothetical protein